MTTTVVRLILIFFFTLETTCAELVFEKAHWEIEAGANDVRTEAIFRFRNKGDKPVEVREVKSSCDCTTAKLKKRRYEPGESGVIVASFTFGERVGEQFKQITVKTDEASNGIHRLSFRVQIPEWLTAAPIALFWSKDAKSEPRKIRVDCPEAAAAKITVKPLLDKVTTEIRRAENGRAYDIIVSPISTEEAFREEILIEAEFADVGKRTLKCYGYVK